MHKPLLYCALGFFIRMSSLYQVRAEARQAVVEKGYHEQINILWTQVLGMNILTLRFAGYSRKDHRKIVPNNKVKYRY